MQVFPGPFPLSRELRNVLSGQTGTKHRGTKQPGFRFGSEVRIAFAWPAMDAFFEEDERIVGHAADSYHRIDIRQSSRHLVVRHRDRIIADTRQPIVLYESGFAPRWYVLRADIDESALTPVEHQTFCPYKGLCSYYDIGNAHLGAWSYREAYAQVGRVSDLVSFEPDIVSVCRSTAPNSVLNRVRQSFRTAPIATLTCRLAVSASS